MERAAGKHGIVKRSELEYEEEGNYARTRHDSRQTMERENNG